MGLMKHLHYCRHSLFCQQGNTVKLKYTVVYSNIVTYLFSFRKSLTIDATVLRLRMGWTLCPASLKDKPWLMTWSIIVARISFETWALFPPLAMAPPPRMQTPLPRAPLPWPLTLLPCLWPLWSMLANSNTEVASFIEGWGLIADWRVVQTSFTQVH